MAIEFKVMPHSQIEDRSVVEVWRDGKLLATVTAEELAAGKVQLRMFSKHLKRVEHFDEMTALADLRY